MTFARPNVSPSASVIAENKGVTPATFGATNFRDLQRTAGITSGGVTRAVTTASALSEQTSSTYTRTPQDKVRDTVFQFNLNPQGNFSSHKPQEVIAEITPRMISSAVQPNKAANIDAVTEKENSPFRLDFGKKFAKVA